MILITGGAYNRWRPLVSWTMATLGSPEPSDADTGNTTTEICFNPHTKWKCRLTFNSEIIEVSDFCWAWNTCTKRVQNAGGRVWNSCFIAVYRFVIFFTFSNIWIFVFCEAFFLEGGLQCTCIRVIFCLKHYTQHLLDVNSLNVGKHTNYSYQTVTLLATYKN